MADEPRPFPGNPKPKQRAAAPAEVIQTPYHDNMSVEEVLEYVKRENPSQVVLVYSVDNEDGSSSTYIRQGGDVCNAEALFLIEKAKLSALGIDV